MQFLPVPFVEYLIKIIPVLKTFNAVFFGFAEDPLADEIKNNVSEVFRALDPPML